MNQDKIELKKKVTPMNQDKIELKKKVTVFGTLNLHVIAHEVSQCWQ